MIVTRKLIAHFDQTLFRDRITRCWRRKLLAGVLLPVACSIPYFVIERAVFSSPHLVPTFWLDRVVPFQPGWTIVYLSLHPIVYAAPWLGRSKLDMKRYALGFALMNVVSFAVFATYPVLGPRPISEHDPFLYRVTILCDRPLNCLPSLHAGLLVYSLSFGFRAGKAWLNRFVIWIMLFWSALILYSTLAVKEHYVVDLLAGAALGILCDQTAWRRINVWHGGDHSESLSCCGRVTDSAGRKPVSQDKNELPTSNFERPTSK